MKTRTERIKDQQNKIRELRGALRAAEDEIARIIDEPRRSRVHFEQRCRVNEKDRPVFAREHLNGKPVVKVTIVFGYTAGAAHGLNEKSLSIVLEPTREDLQDLRKWLYAAELDHRQGKFLPVCAPADEDDEDAD